MAARPTTTVGEVLSLTQGVLANPQVSNSIARLLRRSKQSKDISEALMAELQSGVLSGAAGAQAGRLARYHAQVGNFFERQAKARGIEAVSKEAGPGALGSAAISAAGALVSEGIKSGLFDFSDNDAVESSIGQGLRDTISPGELTMKDAPQTYMSQLQTSPTSGPRRKLGESRMDMTLDTGNILNEAALQRDINLAEEFSSQTFDPNQPFSSVITAPSLKTAGYPSMGIAPMDTYVETSAAPEAYSVKSPMLKEPTRRDTVVDGKRMNLTLDYPNAGPEDLMSLADINKTIDMRPRRIPADDMQGALGQAGPPKAKTKLGTIGDMTVRQFSDALQDPKKREKIEEMLRAMGQQGGVPQ